MKKITKTQPEQRPFCKPQKRQKIIKRPAEETVCKAERRALVAAQLKPRPLVDCPFYNLNYKFDELPLDPVKEFIIEKICKSIKIIIIVLFEKRFHIIFLTAHIQSNAITGRCNKELEFHKYNVENVELQHDECYDGNLYELQLKDIVMPQKFEMLRDKRLHFYGFDDGK